MLVTPLDSHARLRLLVSSNVLWTQQHVQHCAVYGSNRWIKMTLPPVFGAALRMLPMGHM